MVEGKKAEKEKEIKKGTPAAVDKPMIKHPPKNNIRVKKDYKTVTKVEEETKNPKKKQKKEKEEAKEMKKKDADDKKSVQKGLEEKVE